MNGLSNFVTVVEAGSFTAGARVLGTTVSAVSKSMARLEHRLEARLFTRSTRAFSLTPEGEAYYERVAPLVRAIDEAATVLTPSAVAAGRLRISMPADFGRVLMEALTTRFSHSYPQLRLDVGLSDQPVELIREGFDAAIRVGHVDDTNLIAKPLGMLPMALVASPAYLASRGAPDTIASLSRHDHIRYLLRGRPFPISFANGERLVPQGVFDTDSGEAMRIAVRNGLGIAQLLRASVMEDLAAGQLVSVLEKHPLPPVPVQVLHGFARAVPGRVSALFRFLDAEMPRWR